MTITDVLVFVLDPPWRVGVTNVEHTFMKLMGKGKLLYVVRRENLSHGLELKAGRTRLAEFENKDRFVVLGTLQHPVRIVSPLTSSRLSDSNSSPR